MDKHDIAHYAPAAAAGLAGAVDAQAT